MKHRVLQIYFDENGENGLREYVTAELKRCADAVRESVARNRFLNPRGA